MLIVKPSYLDDPNFCNTTSWNQMKSSSATVNIENFPNVFLVGCHFYHQARFEKAQDAFTKILQTKAVIMNKTLHYEAKLNLGACYFKMARFDLALKIF